MFTLGYCSVGINFKQHYSKTTEAAQNTYPDTKAAPREPKPKTVRDEGDGSTPVIKSLVSAVTQPSQKRRRHNSTTEGSDSEEHTTPSKRRRPDSHVRRRHRRSPERHSPVDSTKKSSRDRSRSNERRQRSKRDRSRERKVSSRIVVSNQTTKGQTLKITILQGQCKMLLQSMYMYLDGIEKKSEDCNFSNGKTLSEFFLFTGAFCCSSTHQNLFLV